MGYSKNRQNPKMPGYPFETPEQMAQLSAYLDKQAAQEKEEQLKHYNKLMKDPAIGLLVEDFFKHASIAQLLQGYLDKVHGQTVEGYSAKYPNVPPALVRSHIEVARGAAYVAFLAGFNALMGIMTSYIPHAPDDVAFCVMVHLEKELENLRSNLPTP